MHGTHAECSPDCSHLFEVGKESQMLFFEVSSILMQYYTQRFGVTGWARAHPGKSITRSSGSLSSYVVLARQLTDFQISAHCTQPSSEQVTMLADVPKQACVRSTQHVSEDRRSRPRIELRLTNGWCDERANGCQGREIVCRSEKMRQIEKRTESFFFSAIQFKGTVQLIAAKSRQALMSWRI